MDFAVALQQLCKLLEKEDLQGCADIGAPDKLWDQFIGGVSAGLIWQALQE